MREAKNALLGQRRGEGREEDVEDKVGDSDGWASKLLHSEDFGSKISWASKSASQSFDTIVFSGSSEPAITKGSSKATSSASRVNSASRASSASVAGWIRVSG